MPETTPGHCRRTVGESSTVGKVSRPNSEGRTSSLTCTCRTFCFSKRIIKHILFLKICQSCCKFPKEFDCQSLDCPVLFRKTQASRNFAQVSFLRELLDECLETSSGRPRESNVTASTSAEGTSEDVKDAVYDISPQKEYLGMEFLEDFKHF